MTKKGLLKKWDRKDLIFYAVFMAWPIIQFILFYICVNFNSVLLAFKEIDMSTSPVTQIVSISNFGNNLRKFVNSINISGGEMGKMIRTSVMAWALGTMISTPLGLLFSYYIGKKFPGAGFFRVVLFMPSMISAIVMAPLFKYFISDAFPMILKDFFGKEMSGAGLLYESKTVFGTLLFYRIWLGFGTSVLMYSNVVSEISPEMLEAAKIDGVTAFKEFWHIILPSVYPTFTVFFITSVATIFTDQFFLFDFFGGSSSQLTTIGYVLFIKTETAASNLASYPPLSAFGLVLTVIAVLLTLGTKYFLEKFGPSED